MTESVGPVAKATVYLRLGRVSNLPTVWTNVVAALTLSDQPLALSILLPLCLALSCFYLGGMFLNDAFDRDVDALARPERPIPAGLIGAREVFAVGFLLLFVGWALVAVLAGPEHPLAPHGALALVLAIVLYDAAHRHAVAPFVMGLCRGLVYLTVGLTVGGVVTLPVGIGALLMTAYVTALSFMSKRRPGSHRFVAILIAGIALLDAWLIVFYGRAAIAALTALGFPLTLACQRWVRGT